MTDGHRVFAALYDRLGAPAERGWLGERRANLRHYREAKRVVISEPDPFMREKSESKLSQARVPVEVSDADAQALPFADGSFDTVVSTLVLCTVPDQGSALAEIRRILKPGGWLLFMEHVRGEDQVGRWQGRIESIWRWIAAGCHPNRDTVASIRSAGFSVENLEQFDPPVPLSRFTPFVQGAAIPLTA